METPLCRTAVVGSTALAVARRLHTRTACPTSGTFALVRADLDISTAMLPLAEIVSTRTSPTQPRAGSGNQCSSAPARWQKNFLAGAVGHRPIWPRFSKELHLWPQRRRRLVSGVAGRLISSNELGRRNDAQEQHMRSDQIAFEFESLIWKPIVIQNPGAFNLLGDRKHFPLEVA